VSGVVILFQIGLLYDSIRLFVVFCFTFFGGGRREVNKWQRLSTQTELSHEGFDMLSFRRG